MKTLILSVAIRILLPLFILFSLYILFRGHNHPGGGFIGGLICAIGFIFHTMAHGPAQTVSSFFSLHTFIEPRPAGQSKFVYVLRMYVQNAFSRSELRNKTTHRLRVIKIDPLFIISCGLLLAVTSGVAALFFKLPFMSAFWIDFYLPVIGRPGTPILFDLGVYLLVLGVMLKITFVMAEE